MQVKLDLTKWPLNLTKQRPINPRQAETKVTARNNTIASPKQDITTAKNAC